MNIDSGDEIPIEQRDAREITHGFGCQTAPDGINVYNPAFDITPAELDVMKVLWKIGSGTVQQVIDALPAGEPKPAYTTIMTMMKMAMNMACWIMG